MSYLRVVIYKDEAGEWRWRKQAANNWIIAESGEGYENRDDVLEMAKREAQGAPVEVEDG